MSPRSKAQFEEIREASVRKIREAAFELFGTVGYESTTIAMIAQRAGISKGLMYNYYSGKEDLLKDLVGSLVAEGESMVAAASDGDPRKTLENLIKMTFEWLRKNQKLNRLMFSLFLQVDRFDFIHEIAVSKMAEYLQLLENLLEKINYPDHRTEARILATLFDGIGIQYLVLREDYPLDEIEKMLLNKYCS